MGNCLDVPHTQVRRRPYHSKGPMSRSAPSLGGSTHSLLATAAYPRYVLPGLVEPAYSTPAMNLPSFYQPTQPQCYHPMRMRYSDEFWSSGLYFDNFEEYGYKKKPRNHIMDLTHGELPERNGNIPRKNLNSVIITTSLNPDDDVIKNAGNVILAGGKAPLVQTGVMSNKKTTVTSTIPAVSADKQQIRNPEVKFDTMPKRGSTYITYIEDDPSPPESADDRVDPEAEVESVESGFKETVEGEDGVYQLFIDHQPTTSAVAHPDDPSLTARMGPASSAASAHTLQHILNTYGAATADFVPSDVVVCFGSHEAVALKIKKSLESAEVSVGLSCCSHVNSTRETTRSAHSVIEAKVLVVLLSLESIKLKSLRDLVSLAHTSDTAVFPVSLDQSLDIITSMDMSLKLQLSSYKWIELDNNDYFELILSKTVQAVRDEVNIIRGFEIIDEDYGLVSSKAPRRHKSIRQQLLTRSVDLTTHMTAGSYWLAHYPGLGEVPWDRFLSDIRRNYHELLTCSIPRACNSHFNEALRKELVDLSTGVVHKSLFLEFCKDLGTDKDVWEKLHTVARETQAILDIFHSDSTVKAAVFNKLGTLFNPFMSDIIRDTLKDKDPAVRAVAAVGLSLYALPDDHATHTAVLATLDDLDSVVREAGCRAVTNINSRQALDKLQSLATNDRSIHTREAAVKAIKAINGH